MITIYKYLLPNTVTELMLPKGAIVHSVGQDPKKENSDQLCIWARVDTDAPYEARTFYIAATGRPLHSGLGHKLNFIGTVVTRDRMVFHIHEAVQAKAVAQ